MFSARNPMNLARDAASCWESPTTSSTTVPMLMHKDKVPYGRYSESVSYYVKPKNKILRNSQQLQKGNALVGLKVKKKEKKKKKS
ncbi:hypothetical protein BABINDRAFT_78837 [Babjeviella inositovora NRRL Y-12698]|uniref:Uncharacterized protein n=1 Tax=Babjeviella inositovora NRRL Y-12698 TaxID=984486 RepID=A0A1E3QZ86_9ASCO|nr:uncharacterized protein BABINDRAFT_78837 [Babjeviella inositovora NRRL Y-12698]ODQ82946.1 hypothetical protein BABINDRAFT_78837 [Babjeviella inositovora NRRL Y-12698]